MPNDRLRDAILRNGLTPVVVAERIGVDPKTVERWITQDRTPYPRHRHAIAAMVREDVPYLWPDAVTPEKASKIGQSEMVQLYSRRSAVPYDLWRRLIERAEKRIDVLAYAGLFLLEQDPRLVDILRQKGVDGVAVTILLGDPTSAAIERRSVEEGAPGVMAAKIRQVQQSYKRLDDAPGVKVLYHDTTLYNSIYRFDDEMLVNMHVLGFPAPHAPVMHLRRLNGGDLFGTYADSFDRVLSASKPLPLGEVAA
ncbi:MULTISPECIES: XRE family transcriptional regulator [Micromonospora]|uniref:XRE family transcriptional regulator n=1 Tax=Micromonospora endophytica TaxID=515350 RepID=A0A2W2BYA2_9ACTN|nr:MULTISPECIES: XRE family transcriptional regulator [Micromonospora]PZF92275.1 XRE family transcriptional regulator [Micromonospora endophytica]QKW11798.1 XRE family transcriptional regulator [Verrucosispora sp. NA02020]RIW49222.1 XRE family transcriptional regulator [Micromonospora endophytica]BCJ59001.1 transcriptional regulator [Micromonospora endophytica]